MRTWRATIAAVLAILLCAPIWAASKRNPQPIQDLEAIVAMGKLEIMGKPDPTGARAVGRETQAKLEAAIEKAVAAAKGNADLSKAVKEYYVTATAYFDSVGATDLIEAANSKRAEAALNEKETALELELKLAK